MTISWPACLRHPLGISSRSCHLSLYISDQVQAVFLSRTTAGLQEPGPSLPPSAFPGSAARLLQFPTSVGAEACRRGLGVLEKLQHGKYTSVSDLLAPTALCQLVRCQRKAAFSLLLASLESAFPKQQHIQAQRVFYTLSFFVCLQHNYSVLSLSHR